MLLLNLPTRKVLHHNILLCFDAGVPVVCGTTGWLSQMDKVNKNVKKSMALFYMQVILALV